MYLLVNANMFETNPVDNRRESKQLTVRKPLNRETKLCQELWFVRELLGYNVELDIDRDLAMKLDLGSVMTEFLDGILLDEDNLAVDVEAFLLESLCNLDVVDRAENLAS